MSLSVHKKNNKRSYYHERDYHEKEEAHRYDCSDSRDCIIVARHLRREKRTSNTPEKPEFTASISQEGNAFSLVEAPIHTDNTTTIKVNFSPDKTGDFSGKLLIKDKKDNSYEFNLKGKGGLEKETKEAAPVVQIEPAPNRKVDEMALQWFKSILSTEPIVNIDFGSIKTDALSTLKENDLNSGVIVGTPQFITVKNANKKPYEVIVINWANNNSDTSIGIESDRNGLFTVINAEETKDVELSLTVFSKLPSGANGYKYDNLYAFILLSPAGTTDKLSKLPDSELEKALKNEIEKNTIKKISYSFAIIP